MPTAIMQIITAEKMLTKAKRICKLAKPVDSDEKADSKRRKLTNK
jgi:hypothetical protein